MIKDKNKTKQKALVCPDVIMKVQREDMDKGGDRGKSRDAQRKEESTGRVADCIEGQEQGSNEEVMEQC